jgi:hypothetical protein
LNPLWTFVVSDTCHSGLGGRKADKITVKADGEELGEIGTSYMGSRGTVIRVSNDRIGKNRQRSNAYRTESVDKAVLMAKKMFGKMNPTERIDKAKDAAERVVSRALWNKERECSNYKGTVQGALLNWAESVGYSLFLDYIKTQASYAVASKVRTSIERLEVLGIEMKTIERVQKDFGTDKTALVIKDSGKYLVKIADKVDMYDDNSLPVDMRMKLGMLKLVQDEEYLTDIGCKVTSEIFVLLVDELTNVSEGE